MGGKKEKGAKLSIVLSFGVILITFVFSYLSFLVTQNAKPQSFLDLWSPWDTQHYLFIARNGYPSTGGNQEEIVFFPLYPALIWCAEKLTKHSLAAALLISNLACVGASLMLYRLARLDRDESTALRVVSFCLIFPTAYYFHAGYSESLFLLLTLGTFYQARSGKWATASVLGSLACLTRLTGLALVPALLLEYFQQRRAMPTLSVSEGVRREIVWLLLVPGGFVLYLVLNAYLHGDPFAFLQFQKDHWHKQPGYFWNGLKTAWDVSLRDPPRNAIILGTFEWCAALVAIVLGFVSLIKVRASYGVYVLTSCLMMTASSFWQSTPRYILPLFPIFIVLADLGRGPVTGALIGFASVLLHSLLLGQFIQGAWTY